MSVLTGGVICASGTARRIAGTVTLTDVLLIAAATAINTAIGLYLFTCTVSVSGKTSQNIQILTNQLQALGYTWSISGTTLTINW